MALGLGSAGQGPGLKLELPVKKAGTPVPSLALCASWARAPAEQVAGPAAASLDPPAVAHLAPHERVAAAAVTFASQRVRSLCFPRIFFH